MSARPPWLAVAVSSVLYVAGIAGALTAIALERAARRLLGGTR